MSEINLPIATTDGQRNIQQRLTAFQRELAQAQTELTQTKLMWANQDEDSAALHQDLLTEREARTNAQFERDALALKLAVWRKLGERVTQAYGDEDVIAMAEVIADVWAALGAEGNE